MRRIGIDLDSLFDTRLAVLASIDEVAVDTVLKRKDYWLRENNFWDRLTDNRVSNDLFQEHWVKRDNTILQQSLVTGIIPVLASIFVEFNKNANDKAAKDELCLEINVYPYTLDDFEMDALGSILRNQLFYSELAVHFISVPMEELTVPFINERYSALVMYDFHPWVKHHCNEIPKHNCKGLDVIIPKIFEFDVSRLTADEKKEQVNGFILWMIEYIRFTFIDSRCFSMIRLEGGNKQDG